MPEAPLDIRPFDLAHATDAEYAALNRHFNRAKAETLPDDPPEPLEETAGELRNVPPFMAVYAWAGWDGHGEIRAWAAVSFPRTEENTHLVQFDLNVGPAWRGRGVGRELLRRLVEVPKSEGRRLMMTATNERIPAGEAFLRRVGAECGMEMHTNQLVLAQLDRDLVARWLAEGPARAPGFTVGFWDGPYPEDRLEAIAALVSVMNTAPRDGLDMEDQTMTPGQLREIEQFLAGGGTERWTAYAAEGDRLAGYTEVHFRAGGREIVSQADTGVSPEFRGRGLGRWLKAAMLDRIVRERPEAKFVRKGMASLIRSAAARAEALEDSLDQPQIPRLSQDASKRRCILVLQETEFLSH